LSSFQSPNEFLLNCECSKHLRPSMMVPPKISPILYIVPAFILERSRKLPREAQRRWTDSVVRVSDPERHLVQTL
jgi:hypothetical protein